MRHGSLSVFSLLLTLAVGLPAAAARAVCVPGRCEAAQENRARSQPELQSPNPRYRLRVGDTVEVTLKLTPEYNQILAVQPDGYVSVIGLPDIYVAGKTIPELTEILREKYASTLHDPIVTVVLKDYEKPYFIANGELGRPGKYELRGDTTVLEAIGIAGGFKESSKHSQVLLFRRVSDGWMSVKQLDMKKMIATADLSEDLRLRPGDMIYVPKNTMSKIQRFLPIPSLGIYGHPW
jgi:polysaccharide export outer membrane protein